MVGLNSIYSVIWTKNQKKKKKNAITYGHNMRSSDQSQIMTNLLPKPEGNNIDFLTSQRVKNH